MSMLMFAKKKTQKNRVYVTVNARRKKPKKN
jgi:hypothetical protein